MIFSSRVPSPGSRVPAYPAYPASLRPDLALICDWIKPGSRILDLGCGDGTLLAHLAQTHQVTGYGLEIDPDNIERCIENGVNVIQADLDEGLNEFESQSFDYVVMTQALQALQRPDLAIEEILRVGRFGIVTFPNFGHWRVRLGLAGGRMPVTPALSEQWYDSPNIHLCSVADFDTLCQEIGWQILDRRMLDRRHREGVLIRLRPNLFGEIAMYLLQDREPNPAKA